jgi:outer membrane immunogenic protein
MKKIFLTIVATAALASSGAMAADMAPHAYTKAPAMVSPVTNWSGFYAGVNVGYGWANGDTDFSFLPTPADFDVNNVSLGAKSNGIIGGAQIGYNWQIGSLVTGLEADFQGSGIKGSGSRVPPFTIPADFSELAGSSLSTQQKLSWFGTVRARLGVTVTPDILLYGTGGLAYGHIENSADTFFPGTPIIEYPASVSSTKTGWVAGAGAEWMFARNWSAKAEYLHIDLGRDSTIADAAPAPRPPFQVGYTWHNQFDIVRAGVNYHFN